MNEYIKAYEYEKNVNPPLKNIPIVQKHIMDCSYGITFIDFSELFNVEYKCTSPNLLASFIRIKPDENLWLSNTYGKLNDMNATSHLYYVIQGNAEIFINNCHKQLSTGDLFIRPTFNTTLINNIGTDELQIYYINDSPLLNYLGSKPLKPLFEPAVYSKEFLEKNLNTLSDPNNNRKGILLSNTDTEKLGVNTITPVLWALYNELPPNTVQRIHKHNSVALDLCIQCTDSENIYTLVGDELDENGTILNPTKIHWKTGEMFITPPGLWHSHNNLGNTFAYILPIQDAGLLLYQRILGIFLH
jgi:gentisate 1,2-dioxygenase